MQTETLNTKRTDIMLVDPKNLVVEENFNKRKDYGNLEALARSIVEMGVIEPLEAFKVRGEDKFVLTDGHRRHAACMLAIKFNAAGKEGFEDISKIERIFVRPSSSNLKDRLYIMAVTGEGKKPLTEMEKSDMYNALIEVAKEEGKKKSDAIKEIIEKLGVSSATVYNILKLNELPEEIKTSIAKGEISGTTISSIIREVKEPSEQIRLVREAIANVSKTHPVIEGAKTKKATAKNVKGLKAKTAIQKLKEVVEKLEAKEINNIRAKVLVELVEALENKTPINKIVELFI